MGFGPMAFASMAFGSVAFIFSWDWPAALAWEEAAIPAVSCGKSTYLEALDSRV